MQLSERAHLVGSGRLGLTLSDTYDCNVYLLDCGSELALIDAGAGYRPDVLFSAIEQSGFDLDKVTTLLLTHKHADHSGGAAALQAATGARLYASAETAATVAEGEIFTANLARAKTRGAYPADYAFTGVAVDTVVRNGDQIRVGELVLDVIETPGHCGGHCAFAYRGDDTTVVLTGDAVLPLGQVVLQPIADCSISDSAKSIEQLAKLRVDTLLPGHLAPVLQDGAWHVEAALSRLERGHLPQNLYIPDE